MEVWPDNGQGEPGQSRSRAHVSDVNPISESIDQGERVRNVAAPQLVAFTRTKKAPFDPFAAEDCRIPVELFRTVGKALVQS